MGVVLGAMTAALITGTWRSRGGSAPFVRFILGVFAMLGVLIFLGCPWRAILRLGGGDMNGLIGIAGLAAGSAVAGIFSKRGYSLGEPPGAPRVAGLLMPAVMVMLLALVTLHVSFAPGSALYFSKKGPGAMHAPLIFSLVAGVIVGILAQQSRFCVVGAFRQAAVDRKYRLLAAVVAMLAAYFAGKLITGSFKAGFTDMPMSHTAYIWSFLAMVLCGLAFSLGGGCPGRQLVLCGEGDGDAAIFCAGMLCGAGICHNWNLVAAPDKTAGDVLTVGGPTTEAMVAVGAGIVFCVVVGITAKGK
jgi:YedE family putative selenium metabolism protein